MSNLLLRHEKPGSKIDEGNSAAGQAAKKRLKMGHFPMLAFELFKLMLMFNIYVNNILTFSLDNLAFICVGGSEEKHYCAKLIVWTDNLMEKL